MCSISGLCKSIGFEIALMCDIRIAEEKSVLSFGSRQYGLPLMNEGPKNLAKIIGTSMATDFLLMGRQINADEAQELGIVREIVADGTGIWVKFIVQNILWILYLNWIFSGLGGVMRTAVYLSSLPQTALQHDLGVLNGINFDSERWPSLLNDIKTNISFDEESLKSARVSKLKNMAEWELEEIEHEKNYLKEKNKHSNE